MLIAQVIPYVLDPDPELYKFVAGFGITHFGSATLLVSTSPLWLIVYWENPEQGVMSSIEKILSKVLCFVIVAGSCDTDHLPAGDHAVFKVRKHCRLICFYQLFAQLLKTVATALE